MNSSFRLYFTMIFIIMVGNMVGNSNSKRMQFQVMQPYIAVIIDEKSGSGERIRTSDLRVMRAVRKD